jgi:hypothetical protein
MKSDPIKEILAISSAEHWHTADCGGAANQ